MAGQELTIRGDCAMQWNGEVGAATLAALNATVSPIGGGTTPPTLPQVDLLTAELNALKTEINAFYAHVDKILTMLKG